MTLYRQLLIFTLLLFFVLFAGTWVAKLQSTRTFLNDQLETHAQDTATSLGLSISPPMTQKDLPVVETMINAVFDRGYYRTIRLTDITGKVLINRTLNVSIDNVPKWFINFIPLETPGAESLIMTGWTQAGYIYVDCHPGYAYKTLWETTIRTFILFLLTGAGVTLIGGAGLRILLRPLRRIELQAEALCRKQYETQQPPLPGTRELRSVVEAMNRMTLKVKGMFDEQSRIADQLRKKSYIDPLTGLGNRRYLEEQVATRLNRGESTSRGVFLILQIQDLHKINQEKGFQAGDDLLRKVAKILRTTTEQMPNTALAHLTGGDFTVFIPDAAYGDAKHVAEKVANTLGQLASEKLTLSDNIGHVGAITYDSKTTFSDLLSASDTNLRTAQQAGPNQWVITAMSPKDGAEQQGRGQWRSTLNRVLEKEEISLYIQPAVNCGNLKDLLHVEIFSRIVEDSGEIISAGAFMPLAERSGLSSQLDRLILKKAMQIPAGKLPVARIAINICPASLQNSSFTDWIAATLRTLPPSAPRLIFEFAEYSAIQHLSLIRDFGQRIIELGHSIGIDHFGQSFSNFGYLKSLHPKYVKIDRAYTTHLHEKEGESQFFIGSMCSVAHSLDITVIAEGVEGEEQYNLLKELNVDAIQGYFIDKPKPIDL
jgi:diguanylate cyclase (GGDEF)-like protein